MQTRAGRAVLLAMPLLLALLMVAPAHAGQPVAFTSLSGGCSDGTKYLPLQSIDHPSVMVKFQVAGTGSGSFGSSSPYSSYFSAGDTTWQRWNPVVAQALSPFTVACSPSATWTATFYDVPDPPVTFTGRLSSGTSDAELPFRAPTPALFTGALTLDQGLLYVQPSCSAADQSLASSGPAQLGTCTTGGPNHVAYVQLSNSGPPSTYTFTITAQPVTAGKFIVDKSILAPGQIARTTFSLTGGATINAWIQNAAGQSVRQVATSFVTSDDVQLAWDGRDGSGQPAPDGPYHLHIAANDPYGGASNADSPAFTVDGTGPALARTSPIALKPNQALTFTVTDAAAGVDPYEADLRVDGGYVTPSVSANTLSYTPYNNWKDGMHTFQLDAVDKAGNTGTITGSFTTSGTPTTTTTTPTTTTPAPPRTVASLTRSHAVSYVLRTIRSRAGDGFGAKGSHRTSCSRASRLRQNCKFSASVGDASLSGHGQVWYTTDPDDNQFHYRFAVKLIDDYCYYVTRRHDKHRARKCIRNRTWKH